MSRVSNNLIINNVLGHIQANNRALEKLQSQISSGKRIAQPSDDPIGTVFSIRANARMTDIAGFQQNLSQARSVVSGNDSAFQSVSEILVRVRELGVRASNTTLTQSDRDAIGIELNQLLAQVVNIANTDQGGNTLFAGRKTGTAPFQAVVGTPADLKGRNLGQPQIIGVRYLGDRGDILRDETDNTRIKVNEHGEDAFFNLATQKVYGNTLFADPTGPMSDRLKTGYVTIRGRDGDEQIKFDSTDSLQEVANKIRTRSRYATASVAKEDGGFRLVVEARAAGRENQFALVEGNLGNLPHAATNLLELTGLRSEAGSTKQAAGGATLLKDVDRNLGGGEFYVNGHAVAVDANKDTLQDVADRINALRKNVFADVKDGFLRIQGTGTLSVKDGSSDLPTRIGMVLGRATATVGLSDAASRAVPLQENEWLRNGNFRLNGASLGITDVSTQSLSSLVDTINAAAVGATASIAGGRLRIAAAAGARLTEFTDGTSQMVKSFEFSWKSEAANTPAANTNLNGAGISGSFRIGTQTITIGAADTLSTIADRINFVNTGVRASVDSAGRFSITPNGVQDGLDTSSFQDLPGGNFIASIRLGNSVESDSTATAPLVPGTLATDGVTAGSFVVNGREFSVNPATETLTDIARKVSAAGIGVRAYVTSANRLVFDAQGVVSAFDAAKVTSDPVGLINPVATPLNTFAVPVTSGDFKLNGTTINVDAALTMNDLVNNINNSQSDVRASFNQTTQRLELLSVKPGTAIVLEDVAGGSNITTAFNLRSIANISEGSLMARTGMQTEDVRDRLGNTEIHRTSSDALSIFDTIMLVRDKIFAGDVEHLGSDIPDGAVAGKGVPGGLARLDEAITHNSELRARAGSILNRIDGAVSRYKDIEVFTQQLIADNDDVDMEKAIIQFNSIQAVYQASLGVGARVIQTTLLDFLR